MNVKKLLKKQKSAVMPSESVKRRIAADCGVGEETVTNAGGGVAVKSRGNKIIAACACCCAAAAVTACAMILLNPSTAPTLPNVIETDFGTISTATEFYAYSAVSVGSMLDGTDLESSASGFALANYDANTSISTEITEQQKKTLDKYAVFATGMLGEGRITGSCTVADIDGYEFKLNIGYSDGFGSSADTVLYFNKVADSVKIDGDEEEFAIEGVLVKGGVSFPVEGWYETETEGDEIEHGIEFTAYTSQDRKSYIKMEYEYESETGETESKLVVSVYENDDLTEKAKIKGETGEDTSFKVEIERPTEQENVKEKIKIKFNPYEDNGKKVMHVNADFGGNMHELIMQNRPEEQGGGFEFIPRGNGNWQGEFEDEKDETKDKEDKEDKKDKEDNEDKDEPVPPPDHPDHPDHPDFPDYPDYGWGEPTVPPYGLGD